MARKILNALFPCQDLVYKIMEFVNEFEYYHRFAHVIIEIRRCFHCKIGGCGFKADNLPYYFCGPQCIDEFQGFCYNSSYYDHDYTSSNDSSDDSYYSSSDDELYENDDESDVNEEE
jgi:hypothetical protein